MLKTLQTAAACLWLASASVCAGYLVDSSGEAVRSRSGECVHNRYWNPDQAVVGCDGKVAEVVVVPTEVAVVGLVEPKIEQVVLDAQTNFTFDTAELRPLARTKLDTMLAALQGYDDLVAIRIAGHADRIGDSAYNRGLAMARAEAVAHYLITQGPLDPELLTVVSLGESDPVVRCNDERGDALIACLAPNRRVVIDIEATEIR